MSLIYTSSFIICNNFDYTGCAKRCNYRTVLCIRWRSCTCRYPQPAMILCVVQWCILGNLGNLSLSLIEIEHYGFVECAFTLYPLLFHRGDPSLVKLNVAITCGYLLYGEVLLFLLSLFVFFAYVAAIILRVLQYK